ncbi:MAG: hypothetical protein ACHQ53_12490 [Polyangiales bacterium]
MSSQPQRTPESEKSALPGTSSGGDRGVERARPSAVASMAPAKLVGLLPAAAFLLYLAALLRTAWLSDDVFITLRALDNLVHGYGLVSNPPERVMAFTHPLWALLMLVPYALGAPAYATAMGTGLVVSIAAVAFITWRAAATHLLAALGALWLALSVAFVDFSTSGLENPLAHLLLALFVVALARERLSPLRPGTFALAALIALDRLDHALLIAPVLLCTLFTRASDEHVPSAARPRFVLVRPVSRVLRAVLLGALPLLVWLGFACAYYGFAWPNTAYAKLNSNLASSVLALQGLTYVLDGLQRDPITLLVIGLGLYVCARERSVRSLALGAGVLLYLGYVVEIGGDFMTGRFFTAPFVVCLTWLVTRGLALAQERELLGLALGSVLLGAWFPGNFQLHERFDCIIGPNGIVDERQCWAEYTALSENLRFAKYRSQGRYQHGVKLSLGKERVVVVTNVGMTGFAAGPAVHIIDPLAITDALLARMPFRGYSLFRVGHFDRPVPRGYEETLRTGTNAIVDPCLHAYYDQLATVIRGPLFTWRRWSAIVALNLGKYDRLVQAPCPRDQKRGAVGVTRAATATH